MKRKFVVGITGASGATYAARLLDVLTAAGCDVHLTVSPAAALVIEQELGIHVDLDDFDPFVLFDDRDRDGEVFYHRHDDLMAPIASGSFLNDGMVICPCSGGTLSAVVHGTSANLIHRAAEVQLKERRPLVLVPRETPLSVTQLGNMHSVAQAGAIILPAMPGFYHGVTVVQDLVDFVVARICDQLDVENHLIDRWGSGKGE